MIICFQKKRWRINPHYYFISYLKLGEDYLSGGGVVKRTAVVIGTTQAGWTAGMESVQEQTIIQINNALNAY